MNTKQESMKFNIDVHLGGRTITAHLLDGELWIAISDLAEVFKSDPGTPDRLRKLHRRAIRVIVVETETETKIDALIDLKSVSGWIEEISELQAAKEAAENTTENNEDATETPESEGGEQ